MTLDWAAALLVGLAMAAVLAGVVYGYRSRVREGRVIRASRPRVLVRGSSEFERTVRDLVHALPADLSARLTQLTIAESSSNRHRFLRLVDTSEIGASDSIAIWSEDARAIAPVLPDLASYTAKLAELETLFVLGGTADRTIVLAVANEPLFVAIPKPDRRRVIESAMRAYAALFAAYAAAPLPRVQEFYAPNFDLDPLERDRYLQLTIYAAAWGRGYAVPDLLAELREPARAWYQSVVGGDDLGKQAVGLRDLLVMHHRLQGIRQVFGDSSMSGMPQGPALR